MFNTEVHDFLLKKKKQHTHLLDGQRSGVDVGTQRTQLIVTYAPELIKLRPQPFSPGPASPAYGHGCCPIPVQLFSASQPPGLFFQQAEFDVFVQLHEQNTNPVIVAKLTTCCDYSLILSSSYIALYSLPFVRLPTVPSACRWQRGFQFSAHRRRPRSIPTGSANYKEHTTNLMSERFTRLRFEQGWSETPHQ